MKISPYISKLPFLAGNLSLDYVNTIHDRHEEPIRNLLHSYLDLVTWVYFADAINNSQKERLLQMGWENQQDANRVYTDSLQLREAFYDFVFNMINRKEVSPASMQLIKNWIYKTFSNIELIQSNDGFSLDWNIENIGIESILWPIVRSFADLVTTVDRNRLKQCSNCGYLFVDNSKNKSRRWCSMEICGNRVKARRHAKKTRS